MFFILSKTAAFFAVPSNVLIGLVLIGALLICTRFARAGRRLVFMSVAAIVICGALPAGTLLILPLEDRFPPWDATHGAPDGIIMLGGGLDPDVSSARGQPALGDAAERITVIPDLARRYPQARIVLSGGNASVLGSNLSEARFTVPLLESLGVSPERVLVEDRSRNTAENAEFSKAVAKPKPGERWLLVTSAFHMPRAIGCFRKAGFPVEAYPVDWHTRGRGDLVSGINNIGGGLYSTDFATHEWVGLVAYWLTGRTSALFPGPEPGNAAAATSGR